MADGTATAAPDARTGPGPASGQPRTGVFGGRLERLASFWVTYLAIVVFVLLYIVTVELAARALWVEFRAGVAEATRVSPAEGPIVVQIQNRVSDLVQNSPWVRYGGVQVDVMVFGADGHTPLYVGGGRAVPPPTPTTLDNAMREALALLPAIADVRVSIPPGSNLSAAIFVGYGAVMLALLFVYHRRLAEGERARIEAAVAARDESAQRARSIEEELAKVRDRLREVEPSEQSQAAEVRALQSERASLQSKLRELAARESELRARASRSHDLEEERAALEELLEEALEDVASKEGEIASLEDRLRTASRREPGSGRGRSRESERLGRRLRTLYKNLVVDDRAVNDLAALGDESLKLRAEEVLKRLDEDPETAAIRRKVGGLPPQLSIFELGFAGKGRIYYTRSERGGYRVLAIGGKATQKQDLEYLSRL